MRFRQGVHPHDPSPPIGRIFALGLSPSHICPEVLARRTVVAKHHFPTQPSETVARKVPRVGNGHALKRYPIYGTAWI